MAPLKMSTIKNNPLSNITNMTSRGVNTRSKQAKSNGKQKTTTSIENNNTLVVSKRKATASPVKESVAKRAAFGDITNAVHRKENKLIHIKKVTVQSKVLPTLKVVNQVKYDKSSTLHLNDNHPSFKDYLNPSFYLQKKTNGVPKPPEKVSETLKKNQKTATAKSRASDEFSEASLYVSALGDISTDSKLTNSAKSKTGSRDSVSQLNGIDKLTIQETDDSNTLPEGVIDFDKENWSDPFQVSNYAMDIFEYLKQREGKFVIKDYMPQQKDINGHMRSLLVDWMVEVQEGFELNHETLYLGVKLVDLYLCKQSIVKDELQLLGAASLLISSKFDERYPPALDDFLYICDGAYTLKQLLKMEIKILKVIDFDLGIPISYRFLRRYARCSRVSMPTLTLARYILEFCLMEYAIVPMSDSKIAAAALYLAIRMKNLGSWTPTHVYYSGYSLSDIVPVAQVLNMCLHKKPKQALSTIRTKYTHKVFFGVAQVPLIDNDTLQDQRSSG